MNDPVQLEKKIGYHFQDSSLLRLALTHSSYAHEHHLKKNEFNERIEFLGDAVLELVSSDFLYHHYPDEPEGELTKLRASLVCEPSLAMTAKEIGLGGYLLLGKGEEAGGGRVRPSLTSDAVEAVIGAIYLDGGLEPARAFIERFILNDIENKKLFHDSKTYLQELAQRMLNETPTYELVLEEGPDHMKHYVMQTVIGGRVYGTGEGASKKDAQQAAAYESILMLRKGS